MSKVSDERYLVDDEWSFEGVAKPVRFECSDYEATLEDLRILGLTVKELTGRLGRSPQCFYRWKADGVPQYVNAYIDLAFENLSLRPADG